VDVQGRVDIDEVVNAIPEMPGIISSINVHRGKLYIKGDCSTLRSETVDKGIDLIDQQISFCQNRYEQTKTFMGSGNRNRNPIVISQE